MRFFLAKKNKRFWTLLPYYRITVNETLTKFEQKNPGLFVRIHSGYLLNPAYVRNIRRFAVTLSDGIELPIPEKKYTQIKKLLLNEDTEKK